MSVMLYPCMFCGVLSMELFVLCVACLTVFVNCLLINSQYVWVWLLYVIVFSNGNNFYSRKCLNSSTHLFKGICF